MAEESVGKVSLDLELKSDLQGQIQGLSGKISSLFKKPLVGLSKSTTSQMNKVTDTVKKSVSGIGNPVKKQMQAVVQSVQSGMKKAMNFSKLSKGFKPSGDDKLNSQYQKQLEALKRQEILVSEIQQKLDRAMQGTAKPTALKGLESELKKVQAEIKKTESIYAETEQKMQNAQFSAKLDKGAHGKVSSGMASEISRLEAELDRLGTVLADSDAKAANLQAKISQMQMNPAASSGADILRQKLSLATDKMNRLGAEAQATKAKMDGMNSSGSIFDRLRAKLAGVGGVAKKIGGAFGGILGGIKKAAGGISGFIGKLKHLGSQSKKTQSSMGGLGKGFAKLGTMLKSMILYRGFAMLMNGAKEGFQNLAQYSDSTNQSLSSLMSALTQLKNSFATAFAPILSVVAPILTTFINLLSSAMNKVGAFFAALTGQKSYTRAVSVTQDYAASLDNAATGANDAKKAAQDYQNTLAGFDQVTKLDSQSGADDTPSGSVGGGAGGVSPSEMFETVPIDSGIGSLAEKMKALFNAQDWFGLGAFIGEKVNGLVDKIDFAGLGTKVGKGIDGVFKTVYSLLNTIDFDKIGAGIATFLNNGIANVDFDIVGRTLAKKITIITDTLYGFVTTFNWSQLGQKIADGINGFFDEIDFAKAAQTLSIGIRGLFESIKKVIAGINWRQLGNDIATFLANIDWVGIIRDLAYIIGQAIGGIGLLLYGFIEDAVRSIGDYFSKKMEECGGNVILGLLKGIGDAIIGIFKWLNDNVFLPITQGVLSLFGIHSPSTVFAEIGKNLILGLLQGIQGLWQSIVNFFKTVLTNIKTVFSNAWNGIKTITSNIFNGIKTTISTIINNVKTTVSNVLNTIKTVFSNIWNGIKNTTSNIFNGIKNTITNIINAMKNGIRNGLNAIKNTFSSVFNGIKSIVSNVFNGIWSIIKRIVNSIIGAIEGMANGVIRGLNAMIRALNRLHFSIPSWVPLLGGRSFGFSIPQLSSVYIPKLATGGVIDTPTLAMVGEDGQEAVVPLEKNTGWINNLADKINAQANKGSSGGGITSSELNMAVSRIVSALEALGFYVDSELLAKAVRKGNNKLNRRYNTVIFE